MITYCGKSLMTASGAGKKLQSGPIIVYINPRQSVLYHRGHEGFIISCSFWCSIFVMRHFFCLATNYFVVCHLKLTKTLLGQICTSVPGQSGSGM